MVKFFDKHSPSGATITSQGQAVSRTADRFTSTRDSITSRHGTALSQVGGDPGQVMAGAPSRMQSSATQLYMRAIVAGGAVQEFGGSVSDFNAKVDEWNRQIRNADDDETAEELYKNLLPAYHRAESALSEDARGAKRSLANWDSDSTITSLWKAGALPQSAKTMLPEVGLKDSDLPDVLPYNTASDVLDGLALGNTVAAGIQAWQLRNRTRFAPRGSNGRFISRQDYRANNSWWQRAKGNNNPRNYVPRQGQSPNVSRWARLGRFTKFGGYGLTAATGALDQWSQDSDRTDLDTTHKGARAGTRAAFAVGGTALGATIGGIGGPAGAFVGGAVGGFVGDYVGGLVVDSGAVDWTVDAVSDGMDWAGDKLSDLKFW